jgi:Flp pilus assembly protein protease CpaA
MNPPPLPSKQTKLFANNFVFESMADPGNPVSLLENLLKFPGRVVHELHQARAAILTAWLLFFGIVGVAIYGIVVGSQSGGAQMWIAPAKLGLGTLLSVLICLPSLYIFTCLGGIDAKLRSVCGALFAAVCLSSILLIGFAPVAWIFSQSTDSIVFMGTLHLLFWIIGIRFGLRLIDATGRFLGATSKAHLKIWSVIFILVCFQMTTTLRPIIAPSKTFLPTEKKFFLAHWFETVSESNQGKK